MSEERLVVNPKTGKESTMSDALSKAPPETRVQKKAKLAAILSRGFTIDRANIKLPADLYGEWVHDDPESILHMQNMGFKIDTEHATKSALHNDGTDRAVMADTIFMVCDRETKDIIDEIRREQYNLANGPRGGTKTQAEESEYSKAVDKLGMPVIEESSSRAANKQQIEEALGVDKGNILQRK